MTKKHAQVAQLYFADEVGIGTVDADGVFKIENVLSKTEIKFRYSMAVSAEEAANNIKYKTATKKAGVDWKNYIGLLKVHFAPYPGTTVFPQDADKYNKEQEKKFMNKAGAGNENTNAIENANVQKEEENTMNNIIDNTVNAYMKAAEAAATNPVPDFMTAVNNLMNAEEENTMNEEVNAINTNDCELRKVEAILVAAGGKMILAGRKVIAINDGKCIECKGDVAIECAREIWTNAGKLFDANKAACVRNQLKNLFTANPVKQETTDQSKTDSIENKAPESANLKEENVMEKIVTGVGSRKVDAKGIARIREIAALMNCAGYVLRSGGANGSDSVFEQNMEKKEIYLPNQDIDPRCFEIAATVHPVWDKLPDYAKRLHARNVYQVLGKDLNRPSDICICWTPDGATSEATSSIKTGGTRTAIVLSDRYSVPVYNLFNDEDYETVKAMFKDFAPVNQPSAATNKAPESAVKTKEEETMSNNPYDAIAVMQPAFNPYITVRFNVIQGGKKVPQERSITCLSMKDRMKLAAEGKVKPMKLESPTYYTGSLFNGNKKVGTWTWNTVRWAYPSLTLDTADGKKKTYSFNGSDHDKPLDNVSILLMAMVQAIGTVRGVKSTVKYYPKKASGATATGTPRSVTGTAKPTAPAQAPAVETTPSVEEDVAFFMN